MNKENNKFLLPFKALANPIRLDILDYLVSGEKCVCDIFNHLKLPQNLVSHHLAVLRDANMINADKDGKWVYYSLNPTLFKELKTLLSVYSSPKNKKKVTHSKCNIKNR